MKHEKFVQDAKLSPARYYRNPGDVMRDRRLTDRDRLEILDIWERELRGAKVPPPGEAEDGRVEELQRLRRQLEG